jgi:hypothetical protein
MRVVLLALAYKSKTRRSVGEFSLLELSIPYLTRLAEQGSVWNPVMV